VSSTLQREGAVMALALWQHPPVQRGFELAVLAITHPLLIQDFLFLPQLHNFIHFYYHI